MPRSFIVSANWIHRKEANLPMSAGVRDVHAVDRWMAGGELHGEAEQRHASSHFRWSGCSSEKERPSIIRYWLLGANPELNDRPPLRLMRQGNLEKIAPQVMDAASIVPRKWIGSEKVELDFKAAATAAFIGLEPNKWHMGTPFPGAASWRFVIRLSRDFPMATIRPQCLNPHCLRDPNTLSS